jgi:putative nucleotidyltransferase with HDIG domain
MESFFSDNSITVLIVDDVESVREVLSEFIMLDGYNVELADSGESALEKLETTKIDIAILDVKMEGMNGIELLKRIKQKQKNPIVIMMTAYGTVENATEAFKLGAFDYILKPFDSQKVSATLKNAVNKLILEEENKYLKTTLSLFDIVNAIEQKNSISNLLSAIAKPLLFESSADMFFAYVYNDTLKTYEYKNTYYKDNPIYVGEVDIDRIQLSFNLEQATIFEGEPGVFKNRQKVKLPQISSTMFVPLKTGARNVGLLLFVSLTKGFVFGKIQRNFIKIFAGYIAAAFQNVLLYENQAESFSQTIQSLVHALEAKDEYTQGHSERVTQYAVAIANEMNLSEKDVENIHTAGQLHDIGKIGMHYEKLNKPGKLSKEEWEMFKQHPTIGKKILEPIKSLSEIIPFVYQHHERYDGKGYPEGLKEKEITLGARILAIADTFDAMTSNRSYRNALSKQTAIDEIIKCSGTQFDPDIVPYFEPALEKLIKKRKELGLPYPK